MDGHQFVLQSLFVYGYSPAGLVPLIASALAVEVLHVLPVSMVALPLAVPETVRLSPTPAWLPRLGNFPRDHSAA